MTTVPLALDAHVRPLDRLALLAEAIDRGVHDATAASLGTVEWWQAVPSDTSLLLRIRSDEDQDDGAELGLLPIDGHPFEHLVGLVAPDDWWAVGVVARGRARTLGDGPRPATTSPGSTRPARTTHLVARSGDAACVLRLGDDAPVTERFPVHERTASLGAIDDALRRVLGLPSAPPPPTTVELWAVCWLDAIREGLRAGVLDGSHWPSVAARHPLFTQVPELGEHGDAAAHASLRRWAIEHLDRAGRHFAHRVTWTRLLADERARERGAHEADGELDWMDEGLFAREVLATLESPSEVLDELAPSLSGPTLRRVRSTLRRWDVSLNPT